jgi:uncharacterized protein (TIGR03086 family)
MGAVARQAVRVSAAMARFLVACGEFERVLIEVRDAQWAWPTPCVEWNVRQLVNHMTRGNLNYARLAEGASAAEFLRRRDVDALGNDQIGAYAESVGTCAAAFADETVLNRTLDYPLGRVSGRQALDIRTTDSVVHTWDLARAIRADERFDPDLVTWADEHLADTYAGLPETPVSPQTTHRFFAAPDGTLPPGASRLRHLLHRTGRHPLRA